MVHAERSAAPAARPLASWVRHDHGGITDYLLPRHGADIDCDHCIPGDTDDRLLCSRADIACFDGLCYAMLDGRFVGLPPTRSLTMAQCGIERLIAEGWQGPEERFERRYGWHRTSSGLLARPCRDGRTALITECHGLWMTVDEHGRTLESYPPHLGRCVLHDSFGFDSEEDARDFSDSWLARWRNPR